MVKVHQSRWLPYPYMVKTFKNLLQNQESFEAESWYIASRTVSSNDDPRLTIDFFTARSKLHPYTLIWGKCCKVIFSFMYLRFMAEIYNV